MLKKEIRNVGVKLIVTVHHEPEVISFKKK